MIDLTRFLYQICLTGKSVELLANIVIAWKPLSIFAKNKYSSKLGSR